MSDSIETVRENVHYVVDALRGHRLVIFLGAGANLCDRPDGAVWSSQQRDLPNGSELSNHLWHRFLARSPSLEIQASDELSRVAQAIALELGPGLLKAELREVLNLQSRIPSLHRLIASLPGRIAGQHSGAVSFRPLLVVSTNYDDLMERALEENGKPFHTYTYEADKPGTFTYRSPEGKEKAIPPKPKLNDPLPGSQYPVLMKFHGGLHRSDRNRDSFVITEDHYIEYLATTTPPYVPLPILHLLVSRHVLFLGHSLRDWNLRVILHQLWNGRPEFRSWAIQRDPKPLDRKFWDSKKVRIIDWPLAGYAELIDEVLTEEGLGA
ncbi:MAG TPA: SIR2 family protein [Thermoanaerobaculia bacterium]|nr:SIR2 family protein [Thermoanaerobaculia bacterium]